MTPLGVRRVLVLVTALLLVRLSIGAGQTDLTKEQIREFLLTARIIQSVPIGKGVTQPIRLTLTDGTLTHDAAFQRVDEWKMQKRFADGTMELNFVDSYKYNLAAYALAELLGLDDMMPVTVERRWRGSNGSLTWWVDVLMEEGERLKQNIPAPDTEAWNRQMLRMRVFSTLVADTDRNVGNVIIDRDWKLWMIDFTRAFRRATELEYPGDLPRCDRALLDALQRLTKDAIRQAVGRRLSSREIDAVMARRDLLTAHFQKLITERGEAAVLY